VETTLHRTTAGETRSSPEVQVCFEEVESPGVQNSETLSRCVRSSALQTTKSLSLIASHLALRGGSTLHPTDFQKPISDSLNLRPTLTALREKLILAGFRGREQLSELGSLPQLRQQMIAL
jgi:hypothetical protein